MLYFLHELILANANLLLEFQKSYIEILILVGSNLCKTSLYKHRYLALAKSVVNNVY